MILLQSVGAVTKERESEECEGEPREEDENEGEMRQQGRISVEAGQKRSDVCDIRSHFGSSHFGSSDCRVVSL